MNKEVICSEETLKHLQKYAKIKPGTAKRLAEKAYSNGLNHSETTGNLHKWITSRVPNSPAHSIFKVYGEKLFIFMDGPDENTVRLVTVLAIPTDLVQYVRKCFDKRDKKNEEKH